MKEGEKVLLLLPTKSKKLLMHWKGPYTIIQKVGDLDYRIQMGDKVKTFHANMLRPYREREVSYIDHTPDRGVLGVVSMAIVDVDRDTDQMGTDDMIDPPNKSDTQGPTEVHLSGKLSKEQQDEVTELLQKYPGTMTGNPGYTPLVEHDVKLTSDTPVRLKPYPLPYSMVETVKKEVDDMLNMDIIELSDSPYSSPNCASQEEGQHKQILHRFQGTQPHYRIRRRANAKCR